MSHVLRLSVVSRDRPRRVDAVDEGALEKACPGDVYGQTRRCLEIIADA